MERVFRFFDNIFGCELHTISDSGDQLPIPQIRQVISIGRSRMRVELVTLVERADSSAARVYDVRVQLVSGSEPLALQKPVSAV